MIKQVYTSERLILNPIHISDAPFILRLVNSPGWIEFIGDRKISDTAGAIKYIENIENNSESFFWVVFDKASHQPLGVVSLIQRTYLPYPDIGFAFLAEFGKQGYAFEAASCILEKLAANSEHTTILASTLTNNTNSKRLLERLGLVYVQNILVEGEDLMLYTTDKDQTEIDLLIEAYYAFFKNTTQEWEMIQRFFTVKATITKVTEGNMEQLDVAGFLLPRKKLLTNGTLTDFSEVEIKRHTQIEGRIAHRLSGYRKNGLWDGKLYAGSGTKSFQLIKTTHGWKIHSLIWNDTVLNTVVEA
ncbi:GNAT family N-acetyltransferase [Flavobacterium sp. NKUCC04_CG]|uniref:GNAT family N-acetyltransferase n=1 Tax=Flavobacterium sp. NKUCC04_CG TaxID=2842121 RepID=UPI001C5B0750|nr:GNAT family N-acetyltransferase [Flavobacterium sp. NKUCC04_CG]MBW3520090.1 GNAT family N-acetyltransferase [Flavobacterium sp. NKUCC04_CG]